MTKQDKVKQLLTSLLTEDIVVEKSIVKSKDSSEKHKLNEAEDDFNKAIEGLDQARQGFEKVRSELILYFPHNYQVLFKDNINVILQHMNEGIREVEVLAQKMHQALGK